LPLPSCILDLVGSQLCTRNIFLSSNPISNIIVVLVHFLRHFLRFKPWLASNWSHKLIYNVYSINRMLWYRVWATQFWIRFASSWSHQFETFKIQLSPQIISCDHREGVWSVNLINYGSDCSILFLDQKLFLQFSPKRLNHFTSSSSLCVLLSVLFLTYIICGFSSHEIIGSIFRFHGREQSSDTVVTRVTVANRKKIQIWSLSILIFNWSLPFADFFYFFLLLNYFSKIPLSKLHQNFLKNFLKYNKI
jgi:hypothetical protein